MNPAQIILIALVRIYRWVLSPAKTLLFGPLGRCRFTPTCSAYALQAVREQGAWRGTWLTLKRLARCHPWGGCGLDPVPSRKVNAGWPRLGHWTAARRVQLHTAPSGRRPA